MAAIGQLRSSALRLIGVVVIGAINLRLVLVRDLFDVRHSPGLVEERRIGTVEAEDDEPPTRVASGDPIVLLPDWSVRREMDVDRAVCVPDGLLVIGVEADDWC